MDKSGYQIEEITVAISVVMVWFRLITSYGFIHCQALVYFHSIASLLQFAIDYYISFDIKTTIGFRSVSAPSLLLFSLELKWDKIFNYDPFQFDLDIYDCHQIALQVYQSE